MKPETALVRRLMLAATARGDGTRLFRNNSAVAWVASRTTRNPDGSLTLHDPRPLHAGLCVGSSDLIGWTPHVITAADVGRTVAIFTAVEAKTLRGRASDAQIRFIEAVRAAGGLATVARSTDDLPTFPPPPPERP